jgi:hypothetical protein
LERNEINISFFGYFKKEKNKIDGKWWYEMKFIPSYSTIIFQIQTLKHYYITFRFISFPNELNIFLLKISAHRHVADFLQREGNKGLFGCH